MVGLAQVGRVWPGAREPREQGPGGVDGGGESRGQPLGAVRHSPAAHPTASAKNSLHTSARCRTWSCCRSDPSRTEYSPVVKWIPSYVLHPSRATGWLSTCRG
jgi:hypothetical protein